MNNKKFSSYEDLNRARITLLKLVGAYLDRNRNSDSEEKLLISGLSAVLVQLTKERDFVAGFVSQKTGLTIDNVLKQVSTNLFVDTSLEELCDTIYGDFKKDTGYVVSEEEKAETLENAKEKARPTTGDFDELMRRMGNNQN